MPQASLLVDLDSWLLLGTLAFTRLAPIFFMLPFLNAGVLGGASKMAVIMLVSMGFWPMPLDAVIDISLFPYLAALGREAMIGVVLGMLLSWPFWIFHAVGSMIDNQRGATISSSIDPVNGEETSEMSNFFNWFAAAVFLQGGGLGIFVHLVEASYHICDPLQACQFQHVAWLGLISGLMSSMLAIAAPVVAVMLLCEIMLGLLSRFAPQLNAFSISLTVKSLLAVCILLIYFVPFFPGEILRLSPRTDSLAPWLMAP